MNKLPKRTPLRAIASVILAQDVHQPKKLKAGGASEGSAMPWPFSIGHRPAGIVCWSLLHTGCWVGCTFERLLLCKSGSGEVKRHFVGSVSDLRMSEQRSAQQDPSPCSQLSISISWKTLQVRGCAQTLAFSNGPSGLCSFIPTQERRPRCRAPALLFACWALPAQASGRDRAEAEVGFGDLE